MALRVGTATDRGRRREQNEDRLAVWEPADAAGQASRGTLLVVADGMGGAAAGEVASRIAVETVVERWRAEAARPVRETLHDALLEANRRVMIESVREPSYRGMGTTCTAVVVRGAEVTLAHVGDSRAYLVSGSRARALTRDHTLVAHLVELGQLTPEEARVDSRRNVVTRSVGVGESIVVDVEEWGAVLEPGAALVLCTDGLHGVVGDEEIAQAVAGATPDEAARTLIEAANRLGGPDNITVIVARRESDPLPAPRPDHDVAHAEFPVPTTRPATRGLPSARGALLVGLAALLAAVGWLAHRISH